MKMANEITLPAERERVWLALNDPEVLRICIPGCESLEKLDDGGFRATAKVKVGPIAVSFKGRVVLSDLNPPESYRITGSGDGGVAGAARGGADVRLNIVAAGTVLTYAVDVQISGKLAQLGSRLIDGVAARLANQFFDEFARHLEAASPD